jgi:FKBP-type peptidyl-prolyl cis-trans isomerase
MKPQLPLAILLFVAIALPGCGSSDSKSETHRPERSEPVSHPIKQVKHRCGPLPKRLDSNELGEPGPEKLAEPKFLPPCGPVPKKIIIRDLKEGSGSPATRGDEVTLRYAGIDYQTGFESYGSWLSDGVVIELGAKTRFPGLEAGVQGMRPGGRRELIVPGNLTEGHGALVYVIDLLKVKTG